MIASIVTTFIHGALLSFRADSACVPSIQYPFLLQYFLYSCSSLTPASFPPSLNSSDEEISCATIEVVMTEGVGSWSVSTRSCLTTLFWIQTGVG